MAMTFHAKCSKMFCKVMPKTDPSIKFRPWKRIICIYQSIATKQSTVQKLSKCPPEFGFFSPDAYAVPGVRGTPLPLLHRQCLPRAVGYAILPSTELEEDFMVNHPERKSMNSEPTPPYRQAGYFNDIFNG